MYNRIVLKACKTMKVILRRRLWLLYLVMIIKSTFLEDLLKQAETCPKKSLKLMYLRDVHKRR